MVQLDLFDAAAKARKADPETSQKAAEQLEVALNVKQQQLWIVLAESINPLTAQEAAAECCDRWGGIAETYRKRSGELLRLGRIRQTGVKNCEITGKLAACFRST